jgi:hypothetical protein
VAVLALLSADRTAAQSVLIFVMSAEVIFDEVTAAASALYAVVRSVFSCVVGELVYRFLNCERSVASPLKVVPEAKAVTRLFSNDRSALSLFGYSPSLESVLNAARIAVSSPIVVSEASAIVWTSFRSVWTAVDKVELELELDESPPEPQLELVEPPVEPVEPLVEPLEPPVQALGEPVDPLAELVELLVDDVAVLPVVVEDVELVIDFSVALVEACSAW